MPLCYARYASRTRRAFRAASRAAARSLAGSGPGSRSETLRNEGKLPKSRCRGSAAPAWSFRWKRSTASERCEALTSQRRLGSDPAAPRIAAKEQKASAAERRSGNERKLKEIKETKERKGKKGEKGKKKGHRRTQRITWRRQRSGGSCSGSGALFRHWHWDLSSGGCDRSPLSAPDEGADVALQANLCRPSLQTLFAPES